MALPWWYPMRRRSLIKLQQYWVFPRDSILTNRFWKWDPMETRKSQKFWIYQTQIFLSLFLSSNYKFKLLTLSTKLYIQNNTGSAHLFQRIRKYNLHYHKVRGDILGQPGMHLTPTEVKIKTFWKAKIITQYMDIPDSVLSSLFMSSNFKCNTAHAF